MKVLHTHSPSQLPLPFFVTPTWIAHVLHIPLPHTCLDPNEPFSQVSTDSRSLKKGAFFIPLKGERFDAHHFIAQALHLGTRGFLYEREKKSLWLSTINTTSTHLHTQHKASLPMFWAFEVPSVLSAFRNLARAYREQFSILVYAISGNVGKTTTKELLAHFLAQTGQPVLKTQQSENGMIGIPKTLFQLRPEHRHAVIEIGIDRPGTMEAHLKLVQPKIATLTHLGPEHLEYFGSLKKAMDEEAKLWSWIAQKGGKAFVLEDHPEIQKRADLLQTDRASKYSVSFKNQKATFFATLDKNQLLLRSPQGTVPFTLPVFGKAFAQNLALATAIAIDAGVPISLLPPALQSFQPLFGRFETNIKHDIHFLCDYYNANPSSMEAAFEMALLYFKKHQNTFPSARLFFVLADMLELGKTSSSLHQSLAPLLKGLPLSGLFLFGKEITSLFTKIQLKKNTLKQKTHYFSDFQTLKTHLKNTLRSQDCVLLKGSRGMHLENLLPFF